MSFHPIHKLANQVHDKTHMLINSSRKFWFRWVDRLARWYAKAAEHQICGWVFWEERPPKGRAAICRFWFVNQGYLDWILDSSPMFSLSNICTQLANCSGTRALYPKNNWMGFNLHWSKGRDILQFKGYPSVEICFFPGSYQSAAGHVHGNVDARVRCWAAQRNQTQSWPRTRQGHRVKSGSPVSSFHERELIHAT